ncbi:hypothetical protein B7494_g8192 [Chlorociboria aeruginascens]|nr:hypothetical protein B7494_g8192 [Chlorociboria aeruginascens]
MAVRHNFRSHAHESDIPGTVDLRAREGEETGYGQALFPVPSADPNDPLQWSNFKKTMILIICSLYSFLSNSALLGPSVYLGIYSQEFGITTTTASGLINYPNLAYGFSGLLLVPLYHKIGRRPVLLLSLAMYCAGLIGASQTNSYAGLMICRVIHAFGSGVCEAIPVQLVNDIFFLHERGKKLGYYTACLCLGATGPLYASYMLAGGYSWRLFFYVEFAFAMALLILAFFFVEESRFSRHNRTTVPSDTSMDQESKTVSYTTDSCSYLTEIPDRKSFVSTLSLWSGVDRQAPFFKMSIRLYIGLGALTFNFTFPLKIVAPPYNWSQTSTGLIAISTILGYLLAVPFTFTSDVLAAHLTKKNNGLRESEMRLGVLLAPMIIAPCALILYGFTAERNLHWIGYFFGVALCQWSGFFYFTFTLAYAVDSYTANLSEMLIAMNLGKQAISFGMGFKLLTWILENGYVRVIAGIFAGVLLINNLMVVVFLLCGKRIRILTSKTWLARVHRRSTVVGETH